MNIFRKEKEKREKKEEENGAQNNGKSYIYRVNSEGKSDSHVERRVRNSELFFDNLTWLTSSEATEYLRLPSVGALRVLVFKRQVPFHKLGRNLRFKKCELDRLLDASRTGGI